MFEDIIAESVELQNPGDLKQVQAYRQDLIIFESDDKERNSGARRSPG
jgi:hypothetical protein